MASASSTSAKNLFQDSKQRLAERVQVGLIVQLCNWFCMRTIVLNLLNQLAGKYKQHRFSDASTAARLQVSGDPAANCEELLGLRDRHQQHVGQPGEAAGGDRSAGQSAPHRGGRL